MSCFRYVERSHNNNVVEDLEGHLHRGQPNHFSSARSQRPSFRILTKDGLQVSRMLSISLKGQISDLQCPEEQRWINVSSFCWLCW